MNRAQAPRPKRGGEEFARTHYSEEASSSKKVRFDTRNPAALAADAPEDDAVLDADVIGRRGAQAKRSAVNIDGYESDSSNEGFDARVQQKEKEKKAASKGSKDEEEDDMFADVEEKEFADGDDDEELQKTGKKRKEVKLVDMTNINGQVMSSTSGGRISADILRDPRMKRAEGVESESESESEDDEERRAALDEGMDEELGAGGKKKHAPRLDAFNLKEETEEGAIDEHHNYVRKAADPDAVYDNWLVGTSKKEMRRAKEAHERRERERRAKDQEDDEILTAEILRKLIPQLELGETVMEALGRLGRAKQSKAAKLPKWKAKRRTAEMDVDGADGKDQADEDEAEKRRRQSVEAITDAADRLMRRGHENIYEEEREVLTRLYKRETGEDWTDSAATGETSGTTAESKPDKQWQYRWSDARDGGETHGPYDGLTMEAWNAAGYFGEGVEFRMVGDETATWSRAVTFT